MRGKRHWLWAEIAHEKAKLLETLAMILKDHPSHGSNSYVHKDRKSRLFTIRTVFTSCSYGFLRAIREQLETFDIYKGVLSKGKGNYYRLTYSVNNSLKLSDFMYNHKVPALEGLFLERKRKKFREFVKMRS